MVSLFGIFQLLTYVSLVLLIAGLVAPRKFFPKAKVPQLQSLKYFGALVLFFMVISYGISAFETHYLQEDISFFNDFIVLRKH